MVSPTADLSTTAALAILVFLAVHFYGIREKGFLGYIKDFDPIFYASYGNRRAALSHVIPCCQVVWQCPQHGFNCGHCLFVDPNFVPLLLH